MSEFHHKEGESHILPACKLQFHLSLMITDYHRDPEANFFCLPLPVFRRADGGKGNKQLSPLLLPSSLPFKRPHQYHSMTSH